MLKAVVFVLYWLATLTGVAGLFAGGIPLVNYALARWRNPAFDYYSNFGLISTAANVIILSLMLLIFVHISYVIRGGFRARPKKPGASAIQPPDSSLPANSISQSAETSKGQPAEETPDEKLARLINVKKE
jgi:hypothetical protein